MAETPQPWHLSYPGVSIPTEASPSQLHVVSQGLLLGTPNSCRPQLLSSAILNLVSFVPFKPVPARAVLLIQPSTHANLRCDLARLDHSCISVCAPFEEQGTPLGYLPLRELILSHQGYCLTYSRISFLGSMCCTGGFTRASLSLTALSQFTLNAPTP